MTAWQHDALAADLAAHLRCDKRMVWTDMQLGPAGSPRPDVYTLERSYSAPVPTAYEIKISRSDLRSDTTSGKWQKYLAYAGAVIFAVPDGLCTVADIPTGCGLIVRKDATWRHVRKATRQSCALPMDAAMKLLMDGVDRVSRSRDPAPRKVELWTHHEAVRKKFGDAVAAAARDIASATEQAETFKQMQRDGYARVDREIASHRQFRMVEAQRDMAQFEGAKRELLEWLELPENAGAHTIRRRIAELKTDCDADARVSDARKRLEQARYSVEAALRSLPEIVEPKPVAVPPSSLFEVAA